MKLICLLQGASIIIFVVFDINSFSLAAVFVSVYGSSELNTDSHSTGQMSYMEADKLPDAILGVS